MSDDVTDTDTGAESAELDEAELASVDLETAELVGAVEAPAGIDPETGEILDEDDLLS